MTDAKGGIVGERNPGRGPAREVRLRPLMDKGVDLDLALRIKGMKIGLQPRPRTFDGNLLNGDNVIPHLGYCAASEMNPDRLSYSARPEGWKRTTAAKQRLVHIVMKNVAKAALIFSTEIAR